MDALSRHLELSNERLSRALKAEKIETKGLGAKSKTEKAAGVSGKKSLLTVANKGLKRQAKRLENLVHDLAGNEGPKKSSKRLKAHIKDLATQGGMTKTSPRKSSRKQKTNMLFY